MSQRFFNSNLPIGCLVLLSLLLPGQARDEAKVVVPINHSHRLTVIDYFYLLPDYGIDGDYTTPKQRRELLQFGTNLETNPIIDIHHDYLLIHPDASPAEQIAVFRFRGKPDLIADSMPDFECDYNDFGLYRLRNGKIINVTRQMLPMPAQIDRFLYELPEFGTTVKVFRFDFETESRRHAFDLQWRGGRFVKVVPATI